MQGLNITILPDGRKAIIIRTSDRMAFKSCRRKWGWSSHLKANLGPKNLAAPLWFGSAIHYALEDFHGHKLFDSAADAFAAYCISTSHNYKRELPPDAQEHYTLGRALMHYYENYWLKGYPRKQDETYWCENPETGVLEPQVEVNFEIPVPIEPGSILASHVERLGVDVVLYRGTIDRVVIDEYGHLWVDEYKTAKVAMNTHFQTDPQVTTYVWACSMIYDRPVAGVIYHQFVKKMPEPPKRLSSGKLSTAANMVCSSLLYRQELVNMYGDVLKAPSQNQHKLHELMGSENGDRDRYIIRERIHRNAEQCYHEAQKILLELEDMLNPDLPLYPNPTRDCSRMCSFLTACVNMDDGSDWEAVLAAQYLSRDMDIDRLWRKRLPSPAKMLEYATKKEDPDLEGIQVDAAERADYQQAEIAVGEYELPDWQQNPQPFGGLDEKGSFNMSEVTT
ncbi:exonuclease [Brevundimonas phage vB_BpoS-StAshley]|nr:exonuclease [Brevundimonas phage vB_BpoS-StAshley]